MDQTDIEKKTDLKINKYPNKKIYMQEISCSVSYCYGEIYIYITYSPCLVKADKLNKDKWTLKQLKILLLELTYDEELRKNF